MKLTALLLLICFSAFAQKDSVTLQMLNPAKEGYFKTYEDFLKGNVVEALYAGPPSTSGRFVAKFKVQGKVELLDIKQIWGFSSKAEGLIRINHKTGECYKLISIGDVYYYCPWYTYPQVNPENKKIEYMGPLPHEMISATLNSEMLGQEDLFYHGVKRATEAIAGNPDIYKFELCGHGAFDNMPEKKAAKLSVGWYLSACYLAKSNSRIWLNPVVGGVAYVVE